MKPTWDVAFGIKEAVEAVTEGRTAIINAALQDYAYDAVRLALTLEIDWPLIGQGNDEERNRRIADYVFKRMQGR